MKIQNMRWGYDGGGFGCGPVEGNTYVETRATEGDKNFYILMSRMGEFCKIEIAESPLFDIMMEAAGQDGLTFNETLSKVQKMTLETYDFERESDDPDDYDEEDEIPQGAELYDCPEMFESRFAQAIKLTLKAMDACYEMQEPTDEDAHLFAEEYLGKELDQMEIAF